MTHRVIYFHVSVVRLFKIEEYSIALPLKNKIKEFAYHYLGTSFPKIFFLPKAFKVSLCKLQGNQ